MSLRRRLGALLVARWFGVSMPLEVSQDPLPEAHPKLGWSDYEEARAAMRAFLEAWLVDRDRDRAMAYFIVDDAAMSVAPRVVWVLALAFVGQPAALPEAVGVLRGRTLRAVEICPAEQEDLRSEYWRGLERLRVDPALSAGGGLEGVLDLVDPDLRRIIELYLSVSPLRRWSGGSCTGRCRSTDGA